MKKKLINFRLIECAGVSVQTFTVGPCARANLQVFGSSNIIQNLSKSLTLVMQQTYIAHYCLTKISARSAVNFHAYYILLLSPLHF